MLNQLIEKHLKDNSVVLEKILKKFKSTFETISKISNSLIKLDVVNKEATKTILTKLTGYYMELVTVLRKVEALKKNKEKSYFYNEKAKAEDGEKKFVSKPVEIEASFYVADERRVRDILQGKVDACIEGIRTCRTIIHDNKNIPLGTNEE